MIDKDKAVEAQQIAIEFINEIIKRPGGNLLDENDLITADQLRELIERNVALEINCENYRTVMIAAAEEIHKYWPSHCDENGYGPANLMRRLEAGIPSEYGYKAGDFEEQRIRISILEAEVDQFEAERDQYKADADKSLDIIEQLELRGDDLSKRAAKYIRLKLYLLSDKDAQIKMMAKND